MEITNFNPSVLEISVKEYLRRSLDSDRDNNLCRGWKYLEDNITSALQVILQMQDYWNVPYNDDKVNFILKELQVNEIEEELKKQLGSFVYIYNNKRRAEAKIKEEQDIISRGYTKIFGTQKELDGNKVKGIFSISKIGFMGSFDMLEEKEGTLKYSERFNALMLIPKRSRTRGYPIRDFAFIKSL